MSEQKEMKVLGRTDRRKARMETYRSKNIFRGFTHEDDLLFLQGAQGHEVNGWTFHSGPRIPDAPKGFKWVVMGHAVVLQPKCT